jgi:uncharacterized protein YlxW (UPF0749 family)
MSHTITASFLVLQILMLLIAVWYMYRDSNQDKIRARSAEEKRLEKLKASNLSLEESAKKLQAAKETMRAAVEAQAKKSEHERLQNLSQYKNKPVVSPSIVGQRHTQTSTQFSSSKQNVTTDKTVPPVRHLRVVK